MRSQLQNGCGRQGIRMFRNHWKTYQNPAAFTSHKITSMQPKACRWLFTKFESRLPVPLLNESYQPQWSRLSLSWLSPHTSVLCLPYWRYSAIITWECGWQNKDRSLGYMYLTILTNDCDRHVITHLLSCQRCGLLPNGCNGQEFDWLSGKLVASLVDGLDILFLSPMPSKTSIIYFIYSRCVTLIFFLSVCFF